MLKMWCREFHSGPYTIVHSTKRHVQLLRQKRSPVCNQKKNDAFQKNGIFRVSGNPEQTGRRVQLVDQEEDDDDDDNYTVLKIEGEEDKSKPYFMENFINGNRYKTMIHSSTPVTIFALNELKIKMKRESLQVRNTIKVEK